METNLCTLYFILYGLQLNYILVPVVVLNAFVKAINILKGGWASGDRHGRQHYSHSGAGDSVGVRITWSIHLTIARLLLSFLRSLILFWHSLKHMKIMWIYINKVNLVEYFIWYNKLELVLNMLWVDGQTCFF